MKKTLLYLLIAVTGFAFTSDKPAYKLYNQKGKEIKYSKMLDELKDADIVFFGENHTDPISHWLQYELTVDLYNLRGKDFILGAEMFEADNQLIFDEYMDSLYSDKKFEAEMRLWPNYKTDYKPTVKFAREHGIPYIATNIPRRYASMVHKGGFEALHKLSNEAKQYISPDLERLYDPKVKCYEDMMNMEGMPAHVTENFPKSQASKDATMAYFILKNWEKGKLFLHFDGAYHSDNFEGIVWWINKLKPGLNIKTISVAYQQNIEKLDEENINRANFIITVQENMTQTNKSR
jgi:uncharacterized iron-regulated protein